jgi:hypothetical protein
MKIIKILTILFCTIGLFNVVVAAEESYSFAEEEALESLYKNLQVASKKTDAGRAIRNVILYTNDLGLAVTYIDYTGKKGTLHKKLGKLSRDIREIIIQNADNIRSNTFSMDLKRILPLKMSPAYKETILQWMNGKG